VETPQRSEIPVITLLDFDLGRHNAGPVRLKYAYDQLGEIKDFRVPKWVKGDPDTSKYWKGRKENGIRKWREWFAKQCVFFSYPLDLDMMLLRAFPEAYGVPDADVPDKLAKLRAYVFGGTPPGVSRCREKERSRLVL
jgi:putative ATP-dependent endonuclease of OLD family